MSSSRLKSKISIRRSEVWKLYTSGMNQVDIAIKLGVSQKTVSRDVISSLKEFETERLSNIESYRSSEIASLTHMELAANESIALIQKYLEDRAAGLDVKCTVVPIDLVKWNEMILKIKSQRSKISGLDKATVTLETKEPIKVILRGFAEPKTEV